MLGIIAAVDKNGAIGKDNQLPWHLPDDLIHFKALTANSTVIMGRKTAESLPFALPKRRNIVLTRRAKAPHPNMEIAQSFEEALDLCARDEQVWVIGGAEVYAWALPMADRLVLTHVETAIDGADAFFPNLPPNAWLPKGIRWKPADDKHAHARTFVDYIPK